MPDRRVQGGGRRLLAELADERDRRGQTGNLADPNSHIDIGL
jgi:hypothetical protein